MVLEWNIHYGLCKKLKHKAINSRNAEQHLLMHLSISSCEWNKHPILYIVHSGSKLPGNYSNPTANALELRLSYTNPSTRLWALRFLLITRNLPNSLNGWPTRQVSHTMMTSSNGNIFRVTGHLCGKFTGHRWISHTKASDAELWCLLWSAPEWMVE